jgi:hypothetical protein
LWLFKKANVPDAHPHRFRDTFAVELLLAGVPIDRVSVLLGHSSVKVNEKHYAPWVRSRQEQLEADVARTWATANDVDAPKPAKKGWVTKTKKRNSGTDVRGAVADRNPSR